MPFMRAPNCATGPLLGKTNPDFSTPSAYLKPRRGAARADLRYWGTPYEPGGRLNGNKRTVETYMDGFRNGDHAQVLSCLAEGVEWEIPGAFHLKGKDAFDKEIENDAFVGRPTITITRLTEENEVVVAEGAVRTQKRDGGFLNLRFCDVFEMADGKIRRLISYLVEVNDRLDAQR
jgi:ketosteroid isomerase-like protein